MKTKNLFIAFLASLVLALGVVSCEGYDDDLIDSLNFSRAFSPIGLTAKVRNQTSVELNWTVKEDVSHYVVEFSADDPNFTTIFKRVDNVQAADLPLTVALEGETVYSIRVKGISNDGLEDSKWSTVTVTTLTEQLFLPIVPGDIQAVKATLRWTPNSNVTSIVVNPGNITHTITAAEKTAGIATVSGLSGETLYTAVLYNNTKKRGTLTFTTGVDIGTGILVKTTDDLFAVLAAANAGDNFYLEPGDYSAQTGIITLNKSITIRGLRSYDKPKLKVAFSIVAGASSVNLIDLNLQGDGPDIDSNNDVVRYNEAGNYTSLLISGCVISNYRKSLIGGNVSSAMVTNVTVENSIVTDVWCNGGDFIDFRVTNVANLTLKNSTFNNVASSVATGARDFIRIDAAGNSGTGLTTNVLIDACTLYNVSNRATGNSRILYVRYNSNTSTVRNTLIAETTAIYSNQTTTTSPTCINNNYFNAPNFTNAAISNNKIDTTNPLTLNPGFTNATTGNFKISNQTLIDNAIGDPRWR